MGRKDGGSAGRAEGEEGARVFHSVETFFPLCGKIGKKFSIEVLAKLLAEFVQEVFRIQNPEFRIGSLCHKMRSLWLFILNPEF